MIENRAGSVALAKLLKHSYNKSENHNRRDVICLMQAVCFCADVKGLHSKNLLRPFNQMLQFKMN